MGRIIDKLDFLCYNLKTLSISLTSIEIRGM